MDLAILQIDESEIHDAVFKALNNCDMAKRIGFKKLFIDKMLSGDKTYYDEITESFTDELRELDRFDNWSMIQCFHKVMQERGISLVISPYPNFAHALIHKVMNLKLQEQTRIIAECRAHLSSYDDFIYGLRVNQALYEAQERSYKAKSALLDDRYNKKVKQLSIIAEKAGLLPALKAEIMLLENGSHANTVGVESKEMITIIGGALKSRILTKRAK